MSRSPSPSAFPDEDAAIEASLSDNPKSHATEREWLKEKLPAAKDKLLGVEAIRQLHKNGSCVVAASKASPSQDLIIPLLHLLLPFNESDDTFPFWPDAYACSPEARLQCEAGAQILRKKENAPAAKLLFNAIFNHLDSALSDEKNKQALYILHKAYIAVLLNSGRYHEAIAHFNTYYFCTPLKKKTDLTLFDFHGLNHETAFIAAAAVIAQQVNKQNPDPSALTFVVGWHTDTNEEGPVKSGVMSACTCLGLPLVKDPQNKGRVSVTLQPNASTFQSILTILKDSKKIDQSDSGSDKLLHLQNSEELLRGWTVQIEMLAFCKLQHMVLYQHFCDSVKQLAAARADELKKMHKACFQPLIKKQALEDDAETAYYEIEGDYHTETNYLEEYRRRLYVKLNEDTARTAVSEEASASYKALSEYFRKTLFSELHKQEKRSRETLNEGEQSERQTFFDRMGLHKNEEFERQTIFSQALSYYSEQQAILLREARLQEILIKLTSEDKTPVFSFYAISFFALTILNMGQLRYSSEKSARVDQIIIFILSAVLMITNPSQPNFNFLFSLQIIAAFCNLAFFFLTAKQAPQDPAPLGIIKFEPEIHSLLLNCLKNSFLSYPATFEPEALQLALEIYFHVVYGNKHFDLVAPMMLEGVKQVEETKEIIANMRKIIANTLKEFVSFCQKPASERQAIHYGRLFLSRIGENAREYDKEQERFSSNNPDYEFTT